MNITKEQLEQRKNIYQNKLKEAEYNAFKLKSALEQQESNIDEYKAGIEVVSDLIATIELAEREAAEKAESQPKKRTTKKDEA